MKTQFLILTGGLLWAAPIHGQVTIAAADLFNQPGQYYRAYANNFNPQNSSTSFVVGDIAGTSGTNRFWDFSAGPKEVTFRFDYVTNSGLGFNLDFPNAQVAEQKTDESDGSKQYLFFTQEPGVGRRVYGFYAELPFITPLSVFVPPAIDFPDQMSYGQEWNSSTTYENELSLFDPDPVEGGEFNVLLRNTQTSHFKVDAFGTILLPDEMGVFGEGLRISEEVTLDVAADFGDGTFEPLETDYTRNFYWVMPGYGIVAQLNSVQSSTPPPENFSRATAFLRMFETNKKPTGGGGCTEPGVVTDLRIRLNSTTVLLTWSKAQCATQYRIESTTNQFDPTSWTAVGDPTANTFWQGQRNGLGEAQFYRVISLK